MITGIMLLIGQLLFMTSYVKDNVAFPMPLSKEDEEKFIKLSQKGDENAKKQLINHNLRLVVHIAKKYSNYPDQDELISVGSLGLIKAINSFTLEKGTALATYASRCIENEILMSIRANKKYKNTKSLYESIGFDKEGNEISLIDMVNDNEDTVINIVELNIAKERLLQIVKETLNLREYEIMKMRYGLNDTGVFTQKEVAEKFEISRSYVSRIEKRALSKIKRFMIKENLYF